MEGINSILVHFADSLAVFEKDVLIQLEDIREAIFKPTYAKILVFDVINGESCEDILQKIFKIRTRKRLEYLSGSVGLGAKELFHGLIDVLLAKSLCEHELDVCVLLYLIVDEVLEGFLNSLFWRWLEEASKIPC